MSLHCPVCDSGATRPVREIALRAFFQELTGIAADSSRVTELVERTQEEVGAERYVIFGCERCDLEFAEPMRQPSGRWYAEVYAGFRPNIYRERWEFRHIAEQIRPGDRVLEIGSGSGRFLARLADLGVEAVGVDPNPQAGWQARRQGLTVRESIEKVGAGYDWVCLFHTLEHLDKPRTILEEAVSRLRPGGRVAVSVPSRSSYIEAVWGTSVLSLPPHHMTSWSPKSLSLMLRSLALAEESLLFEPLPVRRFRRGAAEMTVRDSWLARLTYLRGGKRLALSLAQVWRRSHLRDAARGLTGKSLLAVYRRESRSARTVGGLEYAVDG